MSSISFAKGCPFFGHTTGEKTSSGIEVMAEGCDSAGGWDMRISLKNTSGKEIKYITFSFQAINAVNDVVKSEINGESDFSRRCTGPISPNEEAIYTWENVFYNKSVDHFNLVHTKIEYMDASIEEVDGNYFDTYKAGCYVATCVYGSYDCPEVWTLRRYRDNQLAKSWYGRVFIHAYYAISPTLVKWFGETEWFKNMWKPKLDKMVRNLQQNGVESTPYNDKMWR